MTVTATVPDLGLDGENIPHLLGGLPGLVTPPADDGLALEIALEASAPLIASGGDPGYFQIFAQDRGGPVFWRLRAANNRDLGRSVSGFASFADALTSLSRVRHPDTALVPSFSCVEGHRWVWNLRLDGEPAVSSFHTFDRRTRCEAGLAQYLAIAPVAPLRPGLLTRPTRGLPRPRTPST